MFRLVFPTSRRSAPVISKSGLNYTNPVLNPVHNGGLSSIPRNNTWVTLLTWSNVGSVSDVAVRHSGGARKVYISHKRKREQNRKNLEQFTTLQWTAIQQRNDWLWQGKISTAP